MIRIAVEAHSGQFDKVGEPYILHPLAVMLDPELTTETERAVAVGHDLLEDTPITEEYLRENNIPDDVVDGIKSVTRTEGEDYFAFVRRASSHPIGRKVKAADIRHNSSPNRLQRLQADVRRRLEAKYRKALSIMHSDAQT